MSKIKREHHILQEFHKFLEHIQKHPKIKRIIPGRISRQQKASSAQYLHFSYFTDSGLKYKMCKGATAQELFITCNIDDREAIQTYIQTSQIHFLK